MPAIRVAMILPGLGRIQRGAETAFIELARALGRSPEVTVELFGSSNQGIEDLHVHPVPCIRRERFERWPRLPCFRSDTHYEECSFAFNLARRRLYRPKQFDAVISCTYPFVNWYLQRMNRRGGPVHVFVTQNGDWPCRRINREYRYFACDGLVCINPAYYERHRDDYRAVLIPNGVDPEVFRPAQPGDEPSDIAVPAGMPVVLIASALIASKRVADGVRAMAKVPGAFLLVAGDGPERASVAGLAEQLLPGRHRLLGSVAQNRMPGLYRRADVLLHLSQEEPFGIVYLEAASTGLPIVAHDAPVTHWILGDAGAFANTSDHEAVANALRHALSPQTRAVMGKAARERVLSEWTWKKQADRYLDFIRRLLSERRHDESGVADPRRSNSMTAMNS